MENSFMIFGTEHLYAVLGHLGFGIVLIISGVYSKNTKYEWYIRLFIIITLWFIWVYLRVWRIQHDMFSVQEDLPIHLCGFASFLVPVMLINKNKILYEIMYFWGMAGATQSLLTPTVLFGYPHFLYFEFFFTHAMIITGVLYATFVFRYQPTFRGLLLTWGISIALLLPIGIINLLLGSNYFFVAGKPDIPSILDFLGPWPWYLFSLAGVAFILFAVFWLPFPIRRTIKARFFARS
ncbi:MAG: TIGR02206 family membrane protein [Candidatus Marinimicrobia bacterium]|nr:TIGR02206 family membrane protein [Candidatus Neomarinimicrobiota bacterium]